MNIRFTYLLSLLSATLLAACSDPVDEYLNGEGTPTPLNVSISLSDAVQKVQSRAADNSFAAGDVLLAYFEHINGSGASVEADMAPALVTFTVGSDADDSTENLTVTQINGSAPPTGQTTLYWDDFSDSGNDLRTTGHGLRTLYGYCYNGGTPTTDLEPTTGVLGWTVATNQTSGIKTNDLLWSHTIGKQAYTHKENKDVKVGLTIPYLHAMSKVTIVLKAGAGFDTDPFDNTSIELNQLYTKCTVDATESTASDQITDLDEYANITMAKSAETTTEEGKRARVFEAIVVPNNVWNNGGTLATITDMDGNDYYISVTDNILKGFLKKETLEPGDNQVTLKSGTNYKLVITLDKQPQTIVATITDWTDVSASGTGVIKFDADITSHDVNNRGFTNGDKITLWRKTTEKDASYDEDGNDSNGITPATTSIFDGSKWTNTTPIYWPNGSTPYYFRALCKYDGSNYHSFTGEDINHNSLENLMVYKGTDLLWATTAAHNGHVNDSHTDITEFSEGAPIRPRTGTVPLVFKHAMSKVTFKLETSSEAAAQVDFRGAELRLFYMKVGGTVNLSNGDIAANDFVEDVAYYTKENTATGPLTSVTITDGYCFIPQDFEHNDNTVIQIKLKDGTTYSLKLNECKVETGTDGEGKPIYGNLTQWERGKHYTYTIHLEKEKITFRALVKDWENATGSGNATLDWD